MTTDPLPSDGGPLTEAGTIELRRRLTAAEFDIKPEYTGAKSGFGDWRDRSFDPNEVYRDKYGPMLNTAISGRDLCLIDLDVDNGDDVLNIIDVMSNTLATPVTVRHRRNSNRLATMFRQTGDSLYRCIKGSDGAIELFAGERTKLTSFGLHTDKHTGVRTRLQWSDAVPGDLHRNQLPLVTGEAVERFCEAVKPWLGDEAIYKRGTLRDNATAGVDRTADNVDELYRALEYIPNQGHMHWTEWNKIGMALFAGCAGDDLGLAAFVLWTQQNPIHAATAQRDCIKRWREYANSPPTHIGAGTIFKLAQDNGFRRKPNYDDKFAILQAKQRQQKAKERDALTNFHPKDIA